MTKILLLLSFAFGFYSFGQTPSYESVLTYLHENTDVNPVRGDFQIARKPDGYYVCSVVYDNNQNPKSIDCQQIWNAITKKFVSPTYKSGENYSRNYDFDIASRFSNLWGNRRSRAPLLFYGYPGWIDDTKQILENKSKLTSHELETLARTYYEEANDFIHPGQYGLSGFSKDGYEDAGYSKINPERVNGFKKAFDKTLFYWEEIKKREPNYKPNIIVDIDLKLANEYMHGYFTLNCIHEPELAKIYLEKATYSDAVIIYAKNLLKGCDSNGILLTNGDLDTFPLWYVQDQLGFRTDVTVFNTSLAQTSWYLEYLMDRNNLKSSFSPQEVQHNYNRIFMFQGEEEIDFKDWRKSFQLNSKGKLEDAGKEYSVLIDGQWVINQEQSSKIIDKTYYALFYHVFLYDLLVSYPYRKLYAVSLWSFYDLGLNEYSITNGQLFELNIEDSPFMTNESGLKIINQFDALPNDYYAGFGNWHSVLRKGDLIQINQIPSFYATEIIPIVEEKILSDLSIDEIIPTLAVSIAKFYSIFDEKKQAEFKNKYDDAAIQFVMEFVFRPNYLYDDLDELYAVVSIYTSLSENDMVSVPRDQIVWGGSEELHKIIKEKLLEIDKTCRKDNLSISSKRISDLLDVLNACGK